MQPNFLAALLSVVVPYVLGHMELTYPAPFNSSGNPHRTTIADPYLQYPYDCCGPGARWTYPCRGYLSLLGTPQGAPPATWSAGSQQNWSISGIGNHYGGSCQVGFSVDKGETFRVATSYEGNCPHRKAGNGPAGQVFDFTVPSDLQPGVQVFAWTWYNREQEFNMICAAVNITAPEGSPASPVAYTTSAPISTTASTVTHSTNRVPDEPVPVFTTANGCTCTCPSPINITFDDRPEMLVAGVGNGCSTPKTTAELRFPKPGTEVVQGDGEYPLELPTGQCGTGSYGL